MAAAVLPLTMNAYHWDFERPTGPDLILNCAATTASSDLVISGNTSLLADSRASGTKWNEFLHTCRELCPLLPDTAYTVSLRYRAVEPLGPKVFYLLLRSDALGKADGDRRSAMWESRDSNVHEKHFILKTGKAEDYYLIVGIYDQGALVIDDLELVAGPDPPTGRVVASAFPLADEHARFEETARRTGARTWARNIQVVLDPNAWNPALDGDVRYLARLNPDFALYLNVRRDEVRELAVPRSGGSREYQELYHADVKPGETWDELVRRYWDDGFARGLDGEPYMDSTWAEGGYFMCHASTRWHEDFLETTLGELEGRQGIAQDNIGVPALWKGGFAFCPLCEERFAEMLRTRYDPATREGWGIGTDGKFSVREFILRHSLHGKRALRSLVVREYIKFYHRLQIGAWADCALRIRERAPREPTPYLINGNLIGAMGPDPYPVMLTPWVDAVYMEHWWPEARFYEPPRFHGARWGYKLAASATGRTRPVWIENALTGPHGATRSLTTTELTFAEGLASGGYRVFNTGANIPTSEGRRVADVPGMLDLHIRYADFIRGHRGLFQARRPAHRAAVIYSVPTHMFHRFPAVPGLDGIEDYWRFAGACVLLERAGIPYDVVVLPHPELMPEFDWASRLGECDLAVCPGVAALSRSQADVLRDLVRSGSSVVAFGPLGAYDENFNPVETAVLEDETNLHRLGDLDLEFGRDLWQRRDRPDIETRVLEVLEVAHPASRRTIVGLPARDIVADTWTDEDGAFFAVHLVNYGRETDGDTVRPVAGLRFGIRVPESYRIYAPTLVAPDLTGGSASTGPVAAETETDNGLTWVHIPELRTYAIIVFGDMGRVRTRTDYADAVNAAARAACLGVKDAQGWWSNLPVLWEEGNVERIRTLRTAWQAEILERTEPVISRLQPVDAE
jgi:hypothetical protein